MTQRASLGRLVLVLAGVAACGFDASGVSASAGMSIGDASNMPTDASDTDTGSVDATASETQPDSQTSDDSSSGCGGGATCGAPAPDGWIGPFAVNTAAPPNPSQICPPGWMDRGSAFLDLVAPPATCNCDCVPAPATCSVDVRYYSDSGCKAQNETGASSGMCDNLGTGSDHGYVRAVGTPSAVSCAPAEQYVVPPSAWNEASVMCSPSQLPVCDDGVCLPIAPPGFEDHWCVMADGEQACPAGPYSVPRVRYGSVMDTRTCTPCGCNVQGPTTCAGPLNEYTPLCGLAIADIPLDGECHGSNASLISVWSIKYDGPGAQFACANNGPTPVGEAIATDPITICCTG